VLRRLTRLALAPAAAILVAVFAAPASAHVTVHADDPTQGASDAVIAFRTPNEMDNATTVRLQVVLPTGSPLLGVLVEPVPGWTSTVATTRLPKPIQTDDGAVSEVASSITWSGGHIPVGGYQDFNITVGQLPTIPTLTFKAVQTYSNGQVARWIETTAPGAAEPDHPAPALALQPATTAAGTAHPSSSPTAATAVVAQSRSSNGVDRALAIAALLVAVLAAAASGVALLRRPTR